MKETKEIVGTFEFRAIGDDPTVDAQIDEWLQKYPHVTIIDIKYQVVPYVENDVLNFASFALVLFHEDLDNVGSDVNKAATQQMKIPPAFARRRRKQ